MTYYLTDDIPGAARASAANQSLSLEESPEIAHAQPRVYDHVLGWPLDQPYVGPVARVEVVLCSEVQPFPSLASEEPLRLRGRHNGKGCG